MPRRSNCFFFALRAWIRWYNKGAYWSVRKSRHIAGWHWLVNYKGRWIHYEPIHPKEKWLHAAVDKLWYHGYIKRNDSGN